MNRDLDFELYDSTGYWVSRLERAMTEHFQRLLHGCNLTTGEWKILSTVYHDRAKSPGEIASHIGFTSPAVTRLLDNLEKKGLLVRKPGPNRRSLVIALTQKGREITPKISQSSKETNEKFLGVLGEEERIQFNTMIWKILENQGFKPPKGVEDTA